MLIEFRAANHRSIRNEQILTMESGVGGEAGDTRPRNVAGSPKRLLPAAALYGANASGKSNVLSALAFMRAAVIESHRAWEPEGGVPREPFAWGAAASEPSVFEATFVVGGVRHRYGFATNGERFTEEWLHAWPSGRKQIWFQREGEDFRFGDSARGENRLVEKVTRPNALFLSAAAQHGHELLTPLYNWFLSVRLVNVAERRRSMPSRERWLWRALFATSERSRQQSLFGADVEVDSRFQAFRELLRAADVGIVDLKLEDDGEARDGRLLGPRVLVQHASAGQDSWLPLDEESQGTQTLFRLGPVLLDVLASGGLLLVDELEASLHPLLALHVVRLFNDPRSNPRHAQILFTTHDTGLLGTFAGSPSLRRDQVWLTEKDPDGATCLYPLTDYKPRKAENLERGYLQGRYGAVPFLGELPTAQD